MTLRDLVQRILMHGGDHQHDQVFVLGPQDSLLVVTDIVRQTDRTGSRYLIKTL